MVGEAGWATRDRNASQNRRGLLGVATWVIVLVLGVSPLAFGQDGRLNVDLAGSTPRVRSNAPVLLLLEAYWNGSSIAEGRFEARYYADGHDLRSESVSHDVVLTPGKQVIRLVLPTAGTRNMWGQDEVALKFVTEDKTFDLKRYPLVMSGGGRRVNVCVIGPTDLGSSTPAEDEIADALRLGDVLVRQIDPGDVPTVFTRWNNVDVPEQALHFCSFDLVFLRPEGLADLREKQMDALLDWVRAGGSICVLLSPQVRGSHVEFLNALMRESNQRPFVLDTKGALVTDESITSAGMWKAHVELGCAVIFDLDKVSSDPEALWNEARNAAGFLWKVRREVQRSIVGVAKQDLQQMRRQGVSQNRRPTDFLWQPLDSTGRLISELMPADVRVVPLGWIGLILLGYLVLIGPVDYYVLGYWKCRKFTWITYPLMTVAVAVFCVWLSEYFLSSETGGRSLVVRDVGADGSILRESRFDLKFFSRRREIVTEVQNAILTPLDSDRLMLNSQVVYGRQFQQARDRGQSRFEGRIPDGYEVRQVISQWSPEVNRWFSIAPERPKLDQFDWSNKELLEPRMQARLRREAQAAWPNASSIVVYHQGRRQVAGRPLFQRSEAYLEHPQVRRMLREQNRLAHGFDDDLCARPANGLFSLVSRLAPHGGGDFEDITLMDESDPGQAVLLIAVAEEDALVLYRRLYTGLNEK